MIWVLSLILAVIPFSSASSYDDNFEEKLLIKPLPSGHIYSQFRFVVEQKIDPSSTGELKHFHLFPRSISEIAVKHDVQELHMSLTQGLWRYETWGYPYRSAPPGVELWAWFKPGTIDVTSKWFDLVNQLSGQFCASLNFIDEKNTVIPEWSFYPEGAVASDDSYNSSYVRYATLPHEIVCTENLTPFKKLLPCEGKGGLSTLLNSANLFAAHYLSLAIDFKTVCKDKKCANLALKVTQSASLVTDSSIQGNGRQDWSFMKLYGSGLIGTCPLSSVASVILDITTNTTGVPFTMSHRATDMMKYLLLGDEYQKNQYAVYDLKEIFGEQSRPINMAAKYQSKHRYWLIRPPPLYANRYIAGYGQEHGGIHCTIYNRQAKPQQIVYMEVIPWFLVTYIHTLKIKHGDTSITPEYMHYQPAKDRARPHHLEMVLTLPPRSEVKVTLDFDYSFLKWTEYPPDANHGFYVGPAVMSAVVREKRNFTEFFGEKKSDWNKSNSFMRVHTQILLVTLPTPDFSMPYNVICLASTVMALAFGPIHNLTTRKLVAVRERFANEQEPWSVRIKNKFKGLKQKYWIRNRRTNVEPQESSKKDQ